MTTRLSIREFVTGHVQESFHVGTEAEKAMVDLITVIIELYMVEYRREIREVIALANELSSSECFTPGSMGCGYDCHIDEKYGFVPEADCPVHDR